MPIQSMLKPYVITVAEHRWAGHVQRMVNNKLLKVVFYSELRQGKKEPWRTKAVFQRCLKAVYKKKTGISHDTLEEVKAVQRVKWRGLSRKATSALEEQRQQECQRAHVRRYSMATSISC